MSLGIATLVIGLPFWAGLIYEYHWYAGYAPEKVKLGPPIDISGHTELLFSGSCGAAIFQMADNTVESISQNGLAFFEQATTPRGHQPSNYEPWAETPLPEYYTSEGWWRGLLCSDANENLKYKIFEAAKQKGSYYTAMRLGMLLVTPSQKLVVFSYD